ncbi:prostaglandin D2 receptor 2 [Dunckerocampus dactyliophorus]|uniref:prostaglandin D2 receptor 2 n=1 Tax=Dunckerocampus dactyliophorus TaxID=161453 RepID=UPI00240766E6|nr:prostaglandin D2 receptor 2 [Dunckerocampus dactyliophorus]
MANTTFTANSLEEERFCPLLQLMQGHALNNDTKTSWIVVCFHGLVSCLGILENALILWVVGFRLQRRTVASVWVLNLAMSDFLATLTLPLFTLYLSSSNSWELGNPLCKIQASIFFLNMFVSAFLLAAISLDRCLLVVKPVWCQNHRSVARAWRVCLVAWLWAAINMFPYFLFRSVTETVDQRKLCYHNFALYQSSDDTLERDCEVRQIATAISKLLLAFLIPLVVIAGSYVRIGLSLRNRNRKRMLQSTRVHTALIGSDNNNGSGATSPSRNVPLKPTVFGRSLSLTPSSSSHFNIHSQLSQSFTKMVTFVIAAFALCWAPYHIFCMIEVSALYYRENLKAVEVGLPLATTFAFLNPVLNPILYAFSCPHFCVRIRQSLGAVFDGLVEEGGGKLASPRRSIRAHIRQKSVRASPGSPSSPKSPKTHPDAPPVYSPSDNPDAPPFYAPSDNQ